MRCGILALGLVGLWGCAEVDASGGPDASGGVGGSGGDEASCNVPDTSCPAAMPFPGAPCQGALSCDYTENAMPWQWSCESGRWAGSPDCSMIAGGACGVPEPAEGCGDAFGGSLSGAVVSVGPAELGQPFRAFEDGEAAEIEWGPQGGAMIFYRVQIDGSDVPSCVALTTIVSPTAHPSSSDARPVRLRCGETLRMYAVLPDDGCESSDLVDTVLRVEIEGVGSTEVTLSVPGDAFCGGFG